VDEAWIICPDCHTTLKKICPNCQKSLHLRWNICPFCGTHTSVTAAPPDQYDNSSGHVIAETRPMVAVPVAPVEPSAPILRGDETRPHLPEPDPA
jgi:hypothetical protein